MPKTPRKSPVKCPVERAGKTAGKTAAKSGEKSATTRATSASPAAAAIARTPEEDVLVATVRDRQRQMRLPVFVEEHGKTQPDTEDHRLWSAKLGQALGAASVPVALRQLGQMAKVHGATVEHSVGSLNLNADIAAVAGIGPRDQIESMLAVQMVALHNFAMRSLALATHPEQKMDWQALCANQAIRLLRSYREHLEALMRYRGKGQQHVTVEHVHVHQGGQAIVGVGTVAVPARECDRMQGGGDGPEN